MELIKKFDEELKQIYKMEILMNQIVMWLCNGCGLLLMMVPYRKYGAGWGFIPTLLIIACMNYIHPYMKVQEGQRYISIYQKLQYLPVSNSEICRVRIGYLNKYIGKLLVAGLVSQMVGCFFAREWSIWTLIYPVEIIAITWSIVAITIYVPGKIRQ